MPDPIPIRIKEPQPQYLEMLAKETAEGRIKSCIVVYSTEDFYYCRPLAGDLVEARGLLTRAIHEINVALDKEP